MKKLFILLILFLQGQVFALTLEGTVLSIHDGDTFKIKVADSEGKTKVRTVRFLGVDTPEVNFNGHGQGEIAIIARDYLESLVPLESVVQVKLQSEWQLNQRRMLGTVFFQGQDISLKMLESGLAAPYFIAPFDKKLMKNYSQAAKLAFESKLGIYESEGEMPYEFRMSVQHREGTNFVGDLETKILYYPTEVGQVLPYKRLFISSLERAQSLGYRLRE